MNYTYKTHSGIFTDELGNNHTTYGIAVYKNADFNPIRVINDVFCDFNAADAFAKRCTRLSLAPEHLDDAVLDAISA